MVVNTGVGEMLCHIGDHVPLGHREQIPISRQLEAEQGIARIGKPCVHWVQLRAVCSDRPRS